MNMIVILLMFLGYLSRLRRSNISIIILNRLENISKKYMEVWMV